MRAFDSAGKAPARIAASTGNVDAGMASAAKTFAGTFTYNISQATLGTGANATAAGQNPGPWQWRDALVNAAKAFNWTPRVANSVKQTGNVRKGQGIALGGFANSQAAVAVNIEVNMQSGKIVAKHMVSAQVAGLSVAPSLIENQQSGALIMGLSTSSMRRS